MIVLRITSLARLARRTSTSTLPTRRLASTLRVVAQPKKPFSSAYAIAAGLSIAIAYTQKSTVYATPRKMTESADAIKAEERYNDNSYSRQQLLDDLKAMHAGT